MTTLDDWQKSSFSGGSDGNNCLELTSTPTSLHLRESDTPSMVLTTTVTALANLLEGIRTDVGVRASARMPG